jgi:hypothetical protein
MCDVTLAHVREFIKTLLGKGLSPKTIGNVTVILKEMFKHTVQRGIWTQTRSGTWSDPWQTKGKMIRTWPRRALLRCARSSIARRPRSRGSHN